MRLRFVVTTACVWAMVWTSSVALAQGEAKRVSPAEFVILPWSWVPGDAEVLKGIHDCGFNMAGFVAPESLDAVQAAGLKAIVSYGPLHVSDPNVSEEQMEKTAAEIVQKVGKHPGLYGYYLRDEPLAGLFPALARAAQALRKADPNAVPYINLFPNIANVEQLGVASYDEYLEKFIATVKPSFVSYDHYALMDDGSLKDGYFQNLEAVRAAALKHDLPFWNIVLSNSHFHYAEPYEAGFRFQVFTTLAAGARGISYFTYLAPLTGNYRLAPVDQFGHKTRTWDMLRDVNLQIHALVPTLIKLKSVGVFHHGGGPKGSRGLAESKLVAEILADRHLFVGEFEDGQGKPYVLVVNADLHKSTYLQIKFKKPGEIAHINNYTGQATGWGGEDNWLAPGQGALLTVK